MNVCMSSIRIHTTESPYALNTWRVASGVKKTSYEAGPYRATNNFKMDKQT